GADRQRLGEAGHALEQDMTAREQADQQPLDHHVLPDDATVHLLADPCGEVATGIGCHGERLLHPSSSVAVIVTARTGLSASCALRDPRAGTPSRPCCPDGPRSERTRAPCPPASPPRRPAWRAVR